LDEARILYTESTSKYKKHSSAYTIWKFLPNEFSLSARQLIGKGGRILTRLFVGIYQVECRAVSRQRFDKHVPAATDTHATPEELLETVFSTQSVQKVIRTTEARIGSWKAATVQRGLEHGSRGIATVGAISKRHLGTD
jgi:hypothetical protein